MLKRFIGIFIAILLVVFRLTLSLSKLITNPSWHSKGVPKPLAVGTLTIGSK